MPDYKNTVIYTIECNGEKYCGHTTNFKSRKAEHKYNVKNPTSLKYECKVYQFIRENNGWENCFIQIIEEYPCNNVIEARLRERYWLKKLECNLNYAIPSRTIKQYKIDNRGTLAILKKEYKIKNRENINKKRREYYAKQKQLKLSPLPPVLQSPQCDPESA